VLRCDAVGGQAIGGRKQLASLIADIIIRNDCRFS
jgi:hypothetical protein